MEDKIFEMELPVDKNSREFDLKLLKSIIGKTFKTEKFETETRKLWILFGVITLAHKNYFQKKGYYI